MLRPSCALAPHPRHPNFVCSEQEEDEDEARQLDDEGEEESLALKVLEAWSLPRNWAGLTQVTTAEKAGKQMICLDALRVLSMWWIVLGHVFFYGYMGPGHFNNFGFPGEFTFSIFDNSGASAPMQLLPGVH